MAWEPKLPAWLEDECECSASQQRPDRVMDGGLSLLICVACNGLVKRERKHSGPAKDVGEAP